MAVDTREILKTYTVGCTPGFVFFGKLHEVTFFHNFLQAEIKTSFNTDVCENLVHTVSNLQG